MKLLSSNYQCKQGQSLIRGQCYSFPGSSQMVLAPEQLSPECEESCAFITFTANVLFTGMRTSLWGFMCAFSACAFSLGVICFDEMWDPQQSLFSSSLKTKIFGSFWPSWVRINIGPKLLLKNHYTAENKLLYSQNELGENDYSYNTDCNYQWVKYYCKNTEIDKNVGKSENNVYRLKKSAEKNGNSTHLIQLNNIPLSVN